MCTGCCCDPHKRTYIAAIFSGVEAVAFGILNIVLLCMSYCNIVPPDKPPAAGFDEFWSWYFYDEKSCKSHYNYTAPWWISSYPIASRSHTTVQDNQTYQIAYLSLHSLWLIAAFIMIYGNARKLWGYYIPWLLVTLTIIVMDLTITVFYIQDIIDLSKGKAYKSAAGWILVMYIRLLFFWFVNIEEFGNSLNAFCKSYHKRTKQARLAKKQNKKTALEVAEAAARADAAARAEMREQQAREWQRQQHQQSFAPGISNDAYVEIHQAPRTQERPPVPKKPSAPTELRPFNYLNPSFRPADQHDIEGMRSNPASVPKPLANYMKISNSNQQEYIPNDGYTKLPDETVAPAPLPLRFGSMRTLHNQQPRRDQRRFSSTRSRPRTSRYNEYQHHDSGAQYNTVWDISSRPSDLNLVALPRINLAEGNAVIRAPRNADFESHQERQYSSPTARAYPPPYKQNTGFSPTDQERSYPPSENPDIRYSPSSYQQTPNLPPPSTKHNPQGLSPTTYYI
ncbi:uncharacterized protein [Procambarus clarkii]|uniref:uncharacterized protein isoform X1 n=1 Tax=Procambarus clarkii TaxID=6728 RepID=UPI00374204E7